MSRPRLLRALARRLSRSRVLGRFLGGATNGRGDVVDRDLAVLLGLERIQGGGLDVDLPLAERREAFDEACWLAAADPPTIPVRDGSSAGLPVRWYTPPDARGALVFLHGGGWTVGGLDSHDVLCRRLAVEANRVVVAVDYPLAPENRWPGPVHACVDAWNALHPELSTLGDIAIGGDSAGGNLSTCVSRLLRGSGREPSVQLLVYPGLDATMSSASHREFAEGFMLTAAAIRYYLDQYGPDPSHPLGSPVLAEDLEGLPAAVIAVAGFDPLRDEGLLYAERLGAAGVSVRLLDCADMIHGFANMDGLSRAASRHVSAIAQSIRP